MRLAILASHPIQYQAPWFRALARRFDLQVFFAYRQPAAEQADFGVRFVWDIDLLSGYVHDFLDNRAKAPSVNRFGGCDTPELAERIRVGRYDAFVVSGWYLKSYWQAVRACKRNGVPVFVRGDSQLATPRSRFKRLVKGVTHRWLVRQFNGFLVVGERNRQYLEHYGVTAERMFPVRHFVDNDWFAARSRMTGAEREAIRAGWGVDGRTVVALFVGKLIPKKRPGDLLLALAAWARRHRSVKFLGVFVGAGELESALREEAARSRLAVQFLGFKNQTELPHCYAAADVLVLPSDGGETWGLVVNEAMACGLPAITSEAVGCAPDLIIPGETGFSFPTGQVEGLTGCLERLGEAIQAGHDFRPALAARLQQYSIEAAVAGTVRAVEGSQLLHTK